MNDPPPPPAAVIAAFRSFSHQFVPSHCDVSARAIRRRPLGARTVIAHDEMDSTSPFTVIVSKYVPAMSSGPTVVAYGASGVDDPSAHADPSGAMRPYMIEVIPSVDDGAIATDDVLSAKVLLPFVPSGRAMLPATRSDAVIAARAR